MIDFKQINISNRDKWFWIKIDSIEFEYDNWWKAGTIIVYDYKKWEIPSIVFSNGYTESRYKYIMQSIKSILKSIDGLEKSTALNRLRNKLEYYKKYEWCKIFVRKIGDQWLSYFL